MDRPFYLFVGGAAVIGFATVWAATGVALTPSSPPVVVAPPPPMPTGPANPDAASALTVPIRIDANSVPLGDGTAPPLDHSAGASPSAPPAGNSDSITVAFPPPQAPQPVMQAAPPPPQQVAPPQGDAGGPAPPSPPAVQ